jgi:phosphoglycerol transferase MdoB-like AlkP superfamily enzyme
MKKKILLLVFTFLLWTLIFVLQKPVFLIVYGGFAQVFHVIAHGLSLDLSMAGYLSVVPALVLLVSCIPLRQLHGSRASRMMMAAVGGWTLIATTLVALAFVANIALYGYWGFPLDSTPIFFLFSSPSAAMASVEWWQGLLGLLVLGVVMAFILMIFHLLWRKWGGDVFLFKTGHWQWLPMLLLTALLFLPIRGGVTVSTMNTGKAYFSSVQELNHAAVNPLFSFLESVSRSEDFAAQYRFMDDKVAHQIYHKLYNTEPADSVTSVLRPGVKRPNVFIIVMESFSDTVSHVPGVTPNLNRLKREGIYFSRFYANSFRTDRGLVSVLQGYPAPATVSLMKYPRKTVHMPSIASHLEKAGYETSYYYGGDADFTNMRSFLVNQGLRKITSDVDFPVSERLSKWGVPDHLVFRRVEKDILSWPADGKPRLTVIQTSSSHEPFDVPYHRLNDKILNAFAYSDSCVGAFVQTLHKSKLWNNSLVIMVPDHLGAWPQHRDNFKPWRYHIPLIWTGGAIRQPMVIKTLGSQQDIAATLLSQLGIEHKNMIYSKDMLNPAVNHFAFFLPNDGIGMITEDNELIYDNQLKKTVYDAGKEKGKNLRSGKALLQVLFDDISKR